MVVVSAGFGERLASGWGGVHLAGGASVGAGGIDGMIVD